MNEDFKERDELLKLLDKYCNTCSPKDCGECPIAKAYDKIRDGEFDDDLEGD